MDQTLGPFAVHSRAGRRPGSPPASCRSAALSRRRRLMRTSEAKWGPRGCPLHQAAGRPFVLCPWSLAGSENGSRSWLLLRVLGPLSLGTEPLEGLAGSGSWGGPCLFLSLANSPQRAHPHLPVPPVSGHRPGHPFASHYSSALPAFPLTSKLPDKTVTFTNIPITSMPATRS